jgi:hypothetical protein
MALAPIKSGENKKKPALVRLFRKHFPDICAVARRRAYNGDMPFYRRLRACRMRRYGTASGIASAMAENWPTPGAVSLASTVFNSGMHSRPKIQPRLQPECDLTSCSATTID